MGKNVLLLDKRLSEYRLEQGISNTGPMSQQEKEQNMILIIQVPLEHPEPERNYGNRGGKGSPGGRGGGGRGRGSARGASFKKNKRSVDVEDAIIQVGESEGVYKEIGNLDIKRDHRYPIRVTLQYYKATSNGAVNAEIMGQIYDQLCQSRSYGSNIGSLVVGGNTNRPTESVSYGGHPIPVWWNELWLMYKNQFSQYTEQQARDKVFVNGRFCQSTLSQSKTQILSILGANSNNNNNSGWFS